MKEEIQTLKDLQARIESTWALLDIAGMRVELQGLEKTMQEPGFWQDQEKAKEISQRQEEIRSEVEMWTKLKEEVDRLVSLALDLEKSPDTEMAGEIKIKIKELADKFKQLEFYLLLDGKHDKKNAIVAIHAGSGGTEAQDWAEMLRRMLLRYCERKGWKVVIMDESRGQEAGVKSTTFRVQGRYAYGHLQSEHGTHRLVRISPFDAEKMRHTSFALVEVIPEFDTQEAAPLDPKDLRIDTFMSGGHGGQSVNTTYSAVRVVHIPTGLTAQCQNERSQLQNKETALKILHSKLERQREEAEEKEKQVLRGEYKSAEWGNQIRSYVLQPYKLVKDVRIKFEVTDPEAVLNGELDGFVEAYLRWRKSR